MCDKSRRAAPRASACRRAPRRCASSSSRTCIPRASGPALGPFVRDQVEALRRRDDLEVELFAFGPGRARSRGRRSSCGALPRAALRHRPRPLRADGMAGAAGAARAGGRDVARQRPARAALLPRHARGAAVHRARRRRLARVQRATCPARGVTRRVAVLPVGIDLERFRPIPRAEARARLGLDPDGPYLLFPHDPVRPLKRYDRAVEAAGDVPLLTLGGVAPDEVPYWINAANAVLVPSADGGVRAVRDRGARVRRARVRRRRSASTRWRCDGIDGAYCAPWDRDALARRARSRISQAPDPRVDGRARAELFCADAMAARVVEAWRDLLATNLLSNDPFNAVVASRSRPYTRRRGAPCRRGVPTTYERPVQTLVQPALRGSRRHRAADGGRARNRGRARQTPAEPERPSVPAHGPGCRDARAARGRAADRDDLRAIRSRARPDESASADAAPGRRLDEDRRTALETEPRPEREAARRPGRRQADAGRHGRRRPGAAAPDPRPSRRRTGARMVRAGTRRRAPPASGPGDPYGRTATEPPNPLRRRRPSAPQPAPVTIAARRASRSPTCPPGLDPDELAAAPGDERPPRQAAPPRRVPARRPRAAAARPRRLRLRAPPHRARHRAPTPTAGCGRPSSPASGASTPSCTSSRCCLDDVRRQVLVREPGVGGECPHCGELFGSAAHYCSHCGNPLTEAARRELAKAQQQPRSPPRRPVVAPRRPRSPTSRRRRSPARQERRVPVAGPPQADAHTGRRGRRPRPVADDATRRRGDAARRRRRAEAPARRRDGAADATTPVGDGRPARAPRRRRRRRRPRRRRQPPERRRQRPTTAMPRRKRRRAARTTRPRRRDEPPQRRRSTPRRRDEATPGARRRAARRGRRGRRAAERAERADDAGRAARPTPATAAGETSRRGDDDDGRRRGRADDERRSATTTRRAPRRRDAASARRRDRRPPTRRRTREPTAAADERACRGRRRPARRRRRTRRETAPQGDGPTPADARGRRRRRAHPRLRDVARAGGQRP